MGHGEPYVATKTWVKNWKKSPIRRHFFVNVAFWARSENGNKPSLPTLTLWIIQQYIALVDISLWDTGNHIWLQKLESKIEKMPNFYIFCYPGVHLWVWMTALWSGDPHHTWVDYDPIWAWDNPKVSSPYPYYSLRYNFKSAIFGLFWPILTHKVIFDISWPYISASRWGIGTKFL